MRYEIVPIRVADAGGTRSRNACAREGVRDRIDDRFDAALCTWVLCGIPDPGAALAEVGRVLKPGATLHLVEHGLAPDPAVVRWQRRLNPVNRAIAGCLLDNDVRARLDASPLTVTELDEHYEKGTPKAFGFMYEGRARA